MVNSITRSLGHSIIQGRWRSSRCLLGNSSSRIRTIIGTAFEIATKCFSDGRYIESKLTRESAVLVRFEARYWSCRPSTQPKSFGVEVGCSAWLVEGPRVSHLGLWGSRFCSIQRDSIEHRRLEPSLVVSTLEVVGVAHRTGKSSSIPPALIRELHAACSNRNTMGI